MTLQEEKKSEYITRIMLNYKDLSATEKKLADYILRQEPSQPITESVKGLAEKAEVSVATVVRFCKDIGYSGFAELKLMTRQIGFLPSVGNLSLDKSLAIEDLIKNIGEFGCQNLQAFAQKIDAEQLELSIHAINEARQVTIFGIGLSMGLAIIAANIFMSLKIPACTPTDDLMMLRAASLMGPNDVLLVLSGCGCTKPIVDVMMIARETGAKVILLTGNPDSLGASYADFLLCADLHSVPGMLDILTMTMGHLFVLQLLQAGCVARSDKSPVTQVHAISQIMEMTRYASSVKQVERKRVKY